MTTALDPLLDWFQTNMKRSVPAMLLRPPASPADLQRLEAEMAEPDLGRFGWARHDGQDRPPRPKTLHASWPEWKLGWLPGGCRLLGIDELLNARDIELKVYAAPEVALSDQQVHRAGVHRGWLLWAINTLGTNAIYLDFSPGPKGTRGQLVQSLERRPSLLAPSLDAFVARYLEALEHGEVVYDARKKWMSPPGGSLRDLSEVLRAK